MFDSGTESGDEVVKSSTTMEFSSFMEGLKNSLGQMNVSGDVMASGGRLEGGNDGFDVRLISEVNSVLEKLRNNLQHVSSRRGSLGKASPVSEGNDKSLKVWAQTNNKESELLSLIDKLQLSLQDAIEFPEHSKVQAIKSLSNVLSRSSTQDDILGNHQNEAMRTLSRFMSSPSAQDSDPILNGTSESSTSKSSSVESTSKMDSSKLKTAINHLQKNHENSPEPFYAEVKSFYGDEDRRNKAKGVPRKYQAKRKKSDRHTLEGSHAELDSIKAALSMAALRKTGDAPPNKGKLGALYDELGGRTAMEKIQSGEIKLADLLVNGVMTDESEDDEESVAAMFLSKRLLQRRFTDTSLDNHPSTKQVALSSVAEAHPASPVQGFPLSKQRSSEDLYKSKPILKKDVKTPKPSLNEDLQKLKPVMNEDGNTLNPSFNEDLCQPKPILNEDLYKPKPVLNEDLYKPKPALNEDLYSSKPVPFGSHKQKPSGNNASVKNGKQKAQSPQSSGNKGKGKEGYSKIESENDILRKEQVGKQQQPKGNYKSELISHIGASGSHLPASKSNEETTHLKADDLNSEHVIQSTHLVNEAAAFLRERQLRESERVKNSSSSSPNGNSVVNEASTVPTPNTPNNTSSSDTRSYGKPMIIDESVMGREEGVADVGSVQSLDAMPAEAARFPNLSVDERCGNAPKEPSPMFTDESPPSDQSNSCPCDDFGFNGNIESHAPLLPTLAQEGKPGKFSLLRQSAVEDPSSLLDPSALLFTPAQSIQIAIHKAAITKQLNEGVRRRGFSLDEGAARYGTVVDRSGQLKFKFMSEDCDDVMERREETTDDDNSLAKVQPMTGGQDTSQVGPIFNNNDVSKGKDILVNGLEDNFSCGYNNVSSGGDNVDNEVENERRVSFASQPGQLNDPSRILSCKNDRALQLSQNNYEMQPGQNNYDIEPLATSERNGFFSDGYQQENKHQPDNLGYGSEQPYTEYPSAIIKNRGNRKFNNKKLKMKRANTVDLPATLLMSTSYDGDAESENEDMFKNIGSYMDGEGESFENDIISYHSSVTENASGVVQPFDEKESGNPNLNLVPKTSNDKKFLDFLKKYQNSESEKPQSTGLKAGLHKMWSNRFNNIKQSFDGQPQEEQKPLVTYRDTVNDKSGVAKHKKRLDKAKSMFIDHYNPPPEVKKVDNAPNALKKKGIPAAAKFYQENPEKPLPPPPISHNSKTRAALGLAHPPRSPVSARKFQDVSPMNLVQRTTQRLLQGRSNSLQDDQLPSTYISKPPFLQLQQSGKPATAEVYKTPGNAQNGAPNMTKPMQKSPPLRHNNSVPLFEDKKSSFLPIDTVKGSSRVNVISGKYESINNQPEDPCLPVVKQKLPSSNSHGICFKDVRSASSPTIHREFIPPTEEDGSPVRSRSGSLLSSFEAMQQQGSWENGGQLGHESDGFQRGLRKSIDDTRNVFVKRLSEDSPTEVTPQSELFRNQEVKFEEIERRRQMFESGNGGQPQYTSERPQVQPNQIDIDKHVQRMEASIRQPVDKQHLTRKPHPIGLNPLCRSSTIDVTPMSRGFEDIPKLSPSGHAKVPVGLPRPQTLNVPQHDIRGTSPPGSRKSPRKMMFTNKYEGKLSPESLEKKESVVAAFFEGKSPHGKHELTKSKSMSSVSYVSSIEDILDATNDVSIDNDLSDLLDAPEQEKCRKSKGSIGTAANQPLRYAPPDPSQLDGLPPIHPPYLHQMATSAKSASLDSSYYLNQNSSPSFVPPTYEMSAQAIHFSNENFSQELRNSQPDAKRSAIDNVVAATKERRAVAEHRREAMTKGYSLDSDPRTTLRTRNVNELGLPMGAPMPPSGGGPVNTNFPSNSSTSSKMIEQPGTSPGNHVSFSNSPPIIVYHALCSSVWPQQQALPTIHKHFCP